MRSPCEERDFINLMTILRAIPLKFIKYWNCRIRTSARFRNHLHWNCKIDSSELNEMFYVFFGCMANILIYCTSNASQRLSWSSMQSFPFAFTFTRCCTIISEMSSTQSHKFNVERQFSVTFRTCAIFIFSSLLLFCVVTFQIPRIHQTENSSDPNPTEIVHPPTQHIFIHFISVCFRLCFFSNFISWVASLNTHAHIAINTSVACLVSIVRVTGTIMQIIRIIPHNHRIINNNRHCHRPIHINSHHRGHSNIHRKHQMHHHHNTTHTIRSNRTDRKVIRNQEIPASAAAATTATKAVRPHTPAAGIMWAATIEIINITRRQITAMVRAKTKIRRKGKHFSQFDTLLVVFLSFHPAFHSTQIQFYPLFTLIPNNTNCFICHDTLCVALFFWICFIFKVEYFVFGVCGISIGALCDPAPKFMQQIEFCTRQMSQSLSGFGRTHVCLWLSSFAENSTYANENNVDDNFFQHSRISLLLSSTSRPFHFRPGS